MPDGSAVEEVFTVDTSAIDIAIDATGGKFYWTERFTHSIHRANLDGTNVEEIAIVDIADPFSIELDAAAGKMYWTSEANPGRVRRANLDGTDVEDLATTVDGVFFAHGIALSLAVETPIPAVSQWGMIVMALLVSCAATLILPRRHRDHA